MSYVLNAQKRETAGKGAARAIRREGLVPAVIYGDKKVKFGFKYKYNSWNISNGTMYTFKRIKHI